MDRAGLDLGGGYRARPIALDTYRAACARLEGQIFGGGSLYDFDPPSKAPPPPGETFAWGISTGEDLIGWSFAHQKDERTVSMADTGILPEHQGRGLYTRLLPHLLDTFRDAGYTLVQSHHRATNNAVIIPKLRAGFFIQGLNLYEGGLNVALTLSLDRTYREAMHVRSGLRAARGDVAQRLGLSSIPLEETVPSIAVPLPEGQGEDTNLGGGYVLRPVPYEVYYDIYTGLEDAVYSSVSLDWPTPPRLEPPESPRYAWLIGHGGQVVGWQSSRQWDARTAYMVNTGLLPAHRGQGLYTRLLPPVLAALGARGYALVRSHHHATNNAVLVPKLRAGFRVQGLQVDDHGVMAVLIFSFEGLYREYMDVRSGLKRPAGEVARALGLEEP
ncbi:GNAT family N-acetyltransferase [Deinococcus radiopugnans]|uniref:GNAT family N-acetyltransferase n=1 Tax=Deinococcus radiopugnans ATCC 19172 TaxID=585398 RepID=A0A5C4Y2U4_9DEIO|nr:GNAT family N-acetyltransferase [Deinococcus radiopugnans]MBB6017333.1 ribosomal protein S18 acetylase RimI-like enzyme [Deinococcus radiopugnans ATCC 19172]TNM70086.1 GNAT family N-acetyltransferase [Deinococcus radiopugnans ATCC 19172]